MEALVTPREILNIPVDKISHNPNQPRKIFDLDSIRELSESIRQYGLLQPVSVRLSETMKYELVAGERRLRAAKMAGLHAIPAIIVHSDAKLSAVLALIENVQRRDLNYIEEANFYQRLMEEYSFTQETLAEKINKSQSGVANKIRLLKLPQNIRRKLIENSLTERHARALLRLENPEQQLFALEKMAEFDLTVAQSERLIESILNPEEEIEKPKPKKPRLKLKTKDYRIFENSIKETVNTIKKFGFKTEYQMEEVDGGLEFKVKIKL